MGCEDGRFWGVMESIWDVWRVWDEGIVRACGTDWYCEIWQQAFVIVLMDFQNDQMGVRVECLPTLRVMDCMEV
jgi:hypothetical protein